MNTTKTIKTALISVYYKDGLEPLVEKLNKMGVTIYSTGGTQEFLEKLKSKVVAVEDVTSYPSILGGRVKTLHPKVFGGILNRRDNVEDQQQIAEYEIPSIDLVIVDLYPFEETVTSGANEATTIEKIDIGGISLIRAAAKNFNDVVILSSKNQYAELLSILNEKNGATDLNDRKHFAKEAFNTSSHYDSAIFNYFDNNQNTYLKQSIQQSQTLRYGENPHQNAKFFGDLDAVFEKLNGKELSYNNLLDVDAAVNLIDEFTDTTFAILKHNNACGIASRAKLIDAWKDALSGDPVSAFGGILITNTEVDEETALEITKLFFEVIIAPSYSNKALDVLKQKTNRIILKRKNTPLAQNSVKTILNGVLWQNKDFKTETEQDLKLVTNLQPNAQEIDDLLFANKLVKHTKSNTIILAKNKQLLAGGTGQTSRVDALKQAIEKATNFGFNLNGAVMASDAFFPFPDCVEIADKAGIKTVIQPGGSIKDKESIDYCNQHSMKMVVTGVRHFKH